MPLFNASELRAKSKLPEAESYVYLSVKASRAAYDKRFDIFLSHSYLDARTILGLSNIIDGMGYSVYVDWVADKDLSRTDVSRDTAARLRVRMKRSSSLFFATSTNSQYSRWMPWECGYLDGLKGRVAICPVVEGVSHSFNGQEYLGLYPYVDISPPQNGNKPVMWINDADGKYISFSAWLKGKEPVKH